jgi:hypothetical protein
MSKPTSAGSELELLRSILLGEALARLSRIEAEQRRQAEHTQLLSEQLQELQGQWQRAAQLVRAELARLEKNAHDQEALARALYPVIGDLLRRKVAASGAEMAELLAPVLGPALKKQTAISKSAMIEALYPLIGPAAARAVFESVRRRLRQIHVRLRQAFAAFKARPRLVAHRPEKFLALLCVLGAVALIFLLWQRLR